MGGIILGKINCLMVGIIFSFLLSVFCSGLASVPEVTNVIMEQRTDDSGYVNITYDIFDDDGDTLAVALTVSGDNGATWVFPCPSVDGDVGQGVLSGVGKSIRWNLGVDSPVNPGVQLIARVVASDVGVEHTTHSPALYWATELSFLDLTDRNNIERIAKSDVFVFSAWYLWGHEQHEQHRVIEELKSINPELLVLAYVLSKTSKLHWADDPIGSYTRTLFDRTLPYWSYTTEGDTLMDWTNQVVLDVLNPDCRDVIVNTMEEFSQNSNNQVDGVLWDYFSFKIWIAPNIAEQVEGEPDMDQDGIPMVNDPDEIAAFQAGCDSLVILTTEVIGDDFIQVFNGPRAYSDSSFAVLGDGMYYEIFPNQVFPDPPMASALSPDYEKSLFRVLTWPRTINGGPYNVIGNANRSIYFNENGEPSILNFGNLYRAVGLLTGNYCSWFRDGGQFFDWPNVEINLGAPVGVTIIDGNHYFRQYEYGTIDLVMGSGTYPNPFSYEIKINGRVVEALDIPYSYP